MKPSRISSTLAAALGAGVATGAQGQSCTFDWLALGSGVFNGSGNIGVYGLAVFDDGSGPALYVRGNFTEAGGILARGFARWDGTRWTSPLGGGSGGSESPASMLVFDDGSGPALYLADGGVGRFTGTSFVVLGSGGPPAVALAVFDDGSGPALFAGGYPSTTPYFGVGKWNGTAWSTVGGGVTSGPTHGAGVQSMAVFDDDGPGPHAPALHVGGFFEFAGGQPARGIARWDGVSWSGVGGGLTNGLFLPEVHAMAVFDDGQGGGPALYLSGYIQTAGGIPVNSIARWNGSAWSAVGGPLSLYSGRAMLVFDDGGGPALYVAGVGEGVLSHGIARWDGSPGPSPRAACPAAGSAAPAATPWPPSMPAPAPASMSAATSTRPAPSPPPTSPVTASHSAPPTVTARGMRRGARRCRWRISGASSTASPRGISGLTATHRRGLRR